MSQRNLVLVPAIPSKYVRHRRIRSDLSYLPYSLATWRQWCQANDVQLMVADQTVGGDLGTAPPTVQRWQIARDLLANASPEFRLAVVDADTMVRWDAPNFIQLSPGRLSAVRGGTPDWIWRSLEAYRRFLPDVSLDWWCYFNAGIVVIDRQHVVLIDAFLDLYRSQRPALEQIQAAGDFGTDQTLLNLLASHLRVAVEPLPPIYNLLHCIRLSSFDYVHYELQPGNLDRFEKQLLSTVGAFDFIQNAYIWHFTHTVRTRLVAMRATWQRVKRNYFADNDSELPA